MANPDRARLARKLRRKQREHVSVLRDIEDAVSHLEQRKMKLTALEMEIADLERRAAGNDGPGTDPRRAILLFHPMAGRNGEHNHASRLIEIVDALRAHGIQPRVAVQSSRGAARRLARRAVRVGAPLIVVAAGDGTVGDVASQLVGTNTALGVVPLGTMNNVARSLGVPLDIEGACALIGTGITRKIDLGRVVTDLCPEGEYFLECAGIGLSALATVAGEAIEKRRWHALPRALRRFFEAKLMPACVEIDGEEINCTTRMITVLNSPMVGNHLMVAPAAKMDDGLLDVSVYDGMGDGDLVKHFLAAASGTAVDSEVRRGRRVRITSEQAMPANTLTNETTSSRVIEIEVVPQAVSMIVGNGIALTHPVEALPSAPPLAPGPPHTTGDGEKLVESAPS